MAGKLVRGIIIVEAPAAAVFIVCVCVCVCVCVFKDKSWVFLGENQWENDGCTLLEFCPKEHEQWLSKHI